MSLPEHLQAECARIAEATFGDARMLPLELYRSDDVLREELRTVLQPGWHCVGRTADLPRNGDRVVGELPFLHSDGTVSTRSVLVVRGDDGVLRAFDNVCVHRGAQLVAGCGNEARFTCPYHAWVYRLDGQLVGAPYMQRGDTSFDPTPHRLGALALEVWQGFVYVNTTADPAPLAPDLQGLADVLDRFRLADYVPVHQQVDVWSTNWKLLVENFMDTYHVFKVHRATFGATSDSPTNTTMYPGTDAWAHHVALDRDEMARPDNEVLHGDWRRAVVLAAVFPTHVMQVQPDSLWYLQISPLGTDRVRIRWDVSIAPDVLAAQAHPEQYVSSLVDLLTRVNAEDQPVVEGIRRAADGPQFSRGPLSIYEQNVYDFDRHVARRLSGRNARNFSDQTNDNP